MPYEIQVAIIKKGVGLEKAKKIAEEILKKDNAFMRETEDTYRFRNVPKTKFDNSTFRTKKINDKVSLVFGQRK